MFATAGLARPDREFNDHREERRCDEDGQLASLKAKSDAKD